MEGKKTDTRAPTRTGPAYQSPDFDWKRFWIRSLIAVFIFNIVAGLVTWFIIFPILFPAR